MAGRIFGFPPGMRRKRGSDTLACSRMIAKSRSPGNLCLGKYAYFKLSPMATAYSSSNADEQTWDEQQ
jgi:hypothetical protein